MPDPNIKYKEMPLPEDGSPAKNLVIGEVYRDGNLSHVITPHLISSDDLGFNSTSVTDCIFPGEVDYIVQRLVDQYKNHPDDPNTAFNWSLL